MRFFFTYVYVRMLNKRQWTSLRVLSTPYVYVRRKNAALEINPKKETKCIRGKMTTCFRAGQWTIKSHSPEYEIGPINRSV